LGHLVAIDLHMSALFTLQPDAVATVRADSKSAILDSLSARFAAVYALDRGQVLASILEREALGSTGFGRGVAIPHARIQGVNRPVAAFLRLEAPVDFNAADGISVDFVFGLLSPEAAGAAHLHALAAISRLMRDERMHRALAEAPGAEAIYSLLCNVIDRDAA
jgi:PTS system nitrogen regulatory IIA component